MNKRGERVRFNLLCTIVSLILTILPAHMSIVRKEVERLRTFPAETVEESERGMDEAERLLKADANAAILGAQAGGGEG